MNITTRRGFSLVGMLITLLCLLILATILMTSDGSWLAWSPDGQVEGSEAARPLFTTEVVEGGGRASEQSWLLGWDRADEPGLVARIVTPP